MFKNHWLEKPKTVNVKVWDATQASLHDNSRFANEEAPTIVCEIELEIDRQNDRIWDIQARVLEKFVIHHEQLIDERFYLQRIGHNGNPSSKDTTPPEDVEAPWRM